MAADVGVWKVDHKYQRRSACASLNGLKDQDIPAGIFEARRVRWTFHQEFAGQPIRIEVPSFDPPQYTRASWWTDDEGIVSFQNQNIKFVYYRLKY